jgi:hypothetical protein
VDSLEPIGDFVTLDTADIAFNENLYPRISHKPALVQKYAETITLLPPIEVNQDNVLIDGWHRWTAHKKLEIKKIKAVVTHTQSDAEVFELAIKRNALHGDQLSQDDKRRDAQKIYENTPIDQQGQKRIELAAMLSVTEMTIRNWTAQIDQDNRDRRNAEIQSQWLAFETESKIAQSVGMTQQGIGKVVQQIKKFEIVVNGEDFDHLDDEKQRLAEIQQTNRAFAEHASDFSPPLYNIWSQAKKTNEVSHFGNSEARWLDNLLYLYTKPFDVVIDPFAGGGSTIDVCRKRFRRYFVSDRKPIEERKHEIRLHDIGDGLPPLSRWQDVRLVYLDPPYWKQAEGQYSDDPSDLANMDLDAFNESLSGLINGFASKIANGEPSYIALIIQPTQWRAPGRQVADHVLDMAAAVKLPVHRRYSAPYQTQQCTPQMVDWAKETKECLVLTREIIVWRVADG